MEEEVGIKVTRLRRRLSVEADDVKSPSTQSTPTKKRGGRLAAKPQLELIDENATETEKPKRTRKSLARDAEPDEKTITPSRRTTRARSNTSIISDTPAEPEEKGTPARRSTRIKSNTSIVAENVQFADSPRAKRAARRTSQVGSDNEAPITPARQTRRTRKDSTSSIDKQVEPTAGKLGAQIKEVIAEEAENKIKESTPKATPNNESKESPRTRKSPRLNEKSGRKSSSLENDNKENEPHTVTESKNDKGSEVVDGAVISSSKNDGMPETTEESLSVSTSNLIKDLNSEPKKGKANLNKTTTAVEEPQPKSKRHRTKSWTTITSSPSNDSNFLSDTEAIKKKNKRKSNNLSGSGDSILNTSQSVQEIKDQDNIKEVSLNASTLSDKKKKKQHDKSMNNTAIEETSIVNTSTKSDKSTIEANKSKNKFDIDDLNLSQKDDPKFTEKFFEKAPTGAVQSLVYIEDSDSNTGSIDKVNVNKEPESEDQCVPVVEHHLNDENNKESKNNVSYEPMDIDETMPENISLSVFTEKNASGRQEEKRKSLLNISQVNNVGVDSSNKSPRKSIILNQDGDNELNLNKSKRQSLAVPINDTINESMNKSKRKSSASIVDDDDNIEDEPKQSVFEESINKSLSKSKRKSSVANTENDGMDINISNANIENDETENKSANKSRRKSSIANVDQENDNKEDEPNQSKTELVFEESINKSVSKSKRKSSIANTKNENIDINLSNTNIENDETENKSANKSRRKSSITNVDQDSTTEKLNKSKRKSSISSIVNEIDKNSSNTNADDDTKSSNKSKRKSSVSNADIDDNVGNKSMNADVVNNKSVSNILKEDNVDSGINQSSNDDNDINKSSSKTKRKSSIINSENDDSILKDADKSKRKSISMITDNDEVDSSANKSKRKSSIENLEDNVVNKSSNKSKRKSSISNSIPENNLDNSINKSKRQSTVDIVNDTIVDGIPDKSKRQSSVSNTENDYNMDKSTYKSKRKSSISQMESQSFNKSSNENKSTLVLSQIKDISETTVPKDIYEFNESVDSNEQLSKSANVPNIKDKECDKKNLSLTYSTSTPLQQKSMKKLGMQINTSIIAPSSATKTDKKNALDRSKKHTSVLSQNDEESEPSDDDDEEDSEEDDEEEEDSEEENESLGKSKMIDDEAEEASDDYESGDSRDEDEKDYEAQNEIVEKGETLDSEEEEFSDDSDYEKDSFIVDSEEEDNELLSGSGDDLSMSDNELNMSAKSKKKFNERKIKEQKKASREMFEARHNLNESGKSSKSDKPKSKKGNRQRLETSESESDEEVSVKPKKNRRARIDSSQDISQNQLDADKSILSKKKKKVKRLSESACEDASNEKEISILKNNDTEKDDPLSLQNIVKKEPKTPQKDLNISTVAITNIEEVEEVQLDGNVSILKMNQTSDPLQTTVAQDDAMDDDSYESISENEEITKNFESVLKNLNNKSSKVKSQDVSLNLGKKTKQKSKEPIVDQLNLTLVKKSKKKTASAAENSESDLDKDLKSLTNKIIEKVNVQDEGSSDSIDMKLLFNEDSTDGETNVATAKENHTKEVVEDFIPLKRTEGKTNILETTDVTSSTKNDSVLNVSKSKKNKRKSSQPEETATMNGEANENVGFFIDTTGSHTDVDNNVANTSVKESAKKKNQKNNVSSINIEEAKDDDDSNDAPLEVSYRTEKNNKSKQDLNSTQTNENEINTTTSQTPGQSAKKKKKNKKGLDNSQINVEDADAADKSINTSILNVTGGNKKRQSLSESHVEQNIEKASAEPALNVSIGSAKKQKKKTLSESFTVEKVAEEQIPADAAHNVSIGSAKKQKKKTISESAAVEKVCEEETRVNSTHNVSVGSAKKLKKKAAADTSVVEAEKPTEDDTSTNEDNTSKKRKRKPSANPSFDDSTVKDDTKVLNTSKSLNESALIKNKKKKRKIAHNDEEDTAQTEDAVPEIQQGNSIGKKSKKNKPVEELKPAENSHETVNKNKKRKARTDEEDDGDKSSKVTKQNSTDKVFVPRLPANILKQLDEKPKKDIETKTSVTSTTSFVVEQTKKRRTKPSNYLEQSVYLNDSIEEQTKKSQLKKPKVLPFIPTASTSNYGFTTNFKVNVIPQETKFVAQSSDVSNFKRDILQKNRIKKLGTFEMYKRHRNIKISKF